jgi:hypothetical protein
LPESSISAGACAPGGMPLPLWIAASANYPFHPHVHAICRKIAGPIAAIQPHRLYPIKTIGGFNYIYFKNRVNRSDFSPVSQGNPPFMSMPFNVFTKKEKPP